MQAKGARAPEKAYLGGHAPQDAKTFMRFCLTKLQIKRVYLYFIRFVQSCKKITRQNKNRPPTGP